MKKLFAFYIAHALLIKRAVFCILFIPIWFYLRRIYRDRLGAFGCFDDCFNIMAGYFIGQGKHLYSEIFFNHQPIPAYISFFIQTIYHPQSIYELIYRHRMTLIGYFALADVFLTLRFGLPGFAFALLYETTKGYVFGERFLAESMIVYPLVYLLGLAWMSLGKKHITAIELLIASVAAWFVIFSREPYIPLASFLYLIICVRYWPRSRLSFFLVILLSLMTVVAFGFGEYWWNVVSVNLTTNAGSEIRTHGLNGTGIFSIFLYPIRIFFDRGGAWNNFRWIEVAISATLLLSSVIIVYFHRQRWKYVILIFLTLGIANIRPVTPGTVYYVAFHHLVWYALAIAGVVLFLHHFQQSNRTLAFIGWITYGSLVLYAVFSPNSYLYEKVDRPAQFGTGYGHYITQGEIIRRLSDPTQTLFLEEWDDLIYWQAKRPSAYPYSWYTSVMHVFPVYRRARDTMFTDHSPDFYYGQCDRTGASHSLPINRQKDYVQLAQGGESMCLFVKKSIALTIPDERWISVRDFSVDDPRVPLRDAPIIK